MWQQWIEAVWGLSKAFLVCIIAFSIAVVLNNIEVNRKSIISLNLDIQESRKREDLLSKQIKLLSYQIDVLTQKELEDGQQ